MNKVYIKTYGCSYNFSDSEVMKGLLRKKGFNIVDNEEQAELVIVNSCIVKTPTEKKILKYIEQLKAAKKPIIVAGCMAKALPEKVRGLSLMGPTNLKNIVEVVEETLHGNIVEAIADEEIARLNLPKVRKNPVVEILPINEGCLGNCSYCVVKLARGHLRSFRPNDIMQQLKQAVKEGVKEIWLTSQDTACYGKDIGLNLAELLQKLVRIPGDFKIRLGMANPFFIMEQLEDLLDVFMSDKLFKFIHIPVQSADNEILMKMNRFYKAEEFEYIFKKIKQVFPDMTIATDIIVGFPSETEDQFKKSLELVKRLKPEIVNISRYWERPKTKAIELDGKLTTAETKERSRALTEIFELISYQNNKRWLGWEGIALVDEHGKNNSSIARNFAYKPIVVPKRFPLGTKLRVKINKVTSYDLRV